MLKRRQSTIWRWMKRGWPAPEACDEIIAATGGKYTREQLLAPAVAAFKKKRAEAKRRLRRKRAA